MSPRPFHLASQEEIKTGQVTDVYFNRTVQILRARGVRTRVKAEVYLKSLPGDWAWGILAGIEEAAHLLEGLPVDVTAMDEGTRASAPTNPSSPSRGSTSTGRSTRRRSSGSSARPRGSRPRPRGARRSRASAR